MNSNKRLLLTVILTVIITIFLYEPFALFVYKIREPYFKLPIRLESKKVFIRNDSRGDGAFGAKRRNGRSHAGVDIQAPVGTPVYAAKSGIAFKGEVPRGYGKYVMIAHPDGTQTMYGHLSAWNVISGDKVCLGEVIGFVGKTGNAESKAIQAHLHFEIRRRGEPVDPTGLLR